ncbi:MFS transporter [Pseudoroseomonas cervicalis]|uniref:MFS transporter n=1 Tax=Teichococcus cervicalis TaxID=204525 RepID=UPI0022F1DB2B|nr:MFS transporter [Pseudoroseomonas cervicalis]WBV45385.1 MFS transporter [Pseudoroseomonas cervicalis]
MASRRSQRGLDALNFFVADVQTGFGPFVAVYLTSQAWTEVEIGFALSLGTLTAMLSQVPAGALVDSLRHKRRAALAALLAIALSAILLAGFPSTLPVLVSEVLHGFASCILTPSVAAISLALVGRAALGERLGRNARWMAIGGALAAGVMGLVGTYISPAAVFWLTAALTIPAMACLAMIRPDELHPPAPDPQRSARQSGLLQLLRNRGILVFAACCALFTLSNAAMLPMAAAAVTRSVGDEASLIIAACLVVPQLVVAGISPWVGRMAEQHGRRLVLTVGFLALPLRGVLLAMVEHPWALILVQALDGLSAATLGVMLPLLAADLTRGTNRFNLCMGLFGLAVGIGGTLSTSLAGMVATWMGGPTAFAMLGGIGLGCAALAFLAMPETKAPPAAKLPQALPAR